MVKRWGRYWIKSGQKSIESILANNISKTYKVILQANGDVFVG